MANPIRGIQQAAKASQRAGEELRKARAELRAHCQAAQTEGLPMSRIAQEARLPRRTVEDLLRD